VIVHYVPHRLRPVDGHTTRAAVLRDELGAITVVPGQPIPDEADTILVDTFPLGRGSELRPILPRFATTVFLARALVRPRSHFHPFDHVVSWPYEGTEGTVIGPLVPVAPTAERDIDVLVVGSPSAAQRWAGRADALYRDGMDVTLLNLTPWRTLARWTKADAAGLMARSRVVVGAGGTGTLYGALWAGCAFVVTETKPEQDIRVRLARAAGETILDGTADLVGAVRAALREVNQPPRTNGIAALRTLLSRESDHVQAGALVRAGSLSSRRSR
jgi:hypothetical protein